jgi:hypothetical protein
VLAAHLIVDREVLPQAMKLNPGFFRVVYTELLNTAKTRASVQAALSAIDTYLAERAASIFEPVLRHLHEAGEARSATEIEDHFRKNCGIEDVTSACEYLADQGLIGKVPLPVRLTKKSSHEVQELAFFHMSGTTNAG